jgi:alkylhydroperoxidase family enzyme
MVEAKMSSYPIQTVISAPEKSRPVLEKVQQAFGLIPNIAGAMANSPELIKAFIGLFQEVHSGSFTDAEIQTLLLTNAVTNASAWPVAFHTMLALKEGLMAADVEAIRSGRLPADEKLAALSGFARKLIETRGHVDDHDLEVVIDAGYRREQVLEVLAVTAASTITNYVGVITSPPLEEFLRPHAGQV